MAYHLTNDERFLMTVREAWSKRIVWNLFISWRQWIIFSRAFNDVLSSVKCLCNSHKDVANALWCFTYSMPLSTAVEQALIM